MLYWSILGMEILHLAASFVRECTYISCVAGEGVHLTVHKESVTA